MAVNQPWDFDAVLGGKNHPPTSGIVLGGIEGVISRLESSIIDARIEALSDALNYGDTGLDLVIDALGNEFAKVRRKAFLILRDRINHPNVKQALLDYSPWEYFIKLEDWQTENYNYQTGITNPEDTAYIVNIQQLKLLLQDPNASKVEALVCQMVSMGYYEVSEEFNDFVANIHKAKNILTNLKALFIGDAQEQDYKKSWLGLGDISLILEVYPKLEALQLRGNCEYLECRTLKHKSLKTLIIETANTSDAAISDITSIHLPELEYFELWIGRHSSYDYSEPIEKLQPIFSGKFFPNLTYLGLRSCDYADEIAAALTESYIIESLSLLDLSMGRLTDEGFATLLKCPAIHRLHTLNISHNCVSEESIEEAEELLQLGCCLIAYSQEEMIDCGVGISRYCALYE
ncbi:MAG: HEAT repeat domain-containing protein [Scytonematopsis contorta HA4267-MV1]|jgi:hypothetical protein|nr:HEAT repeat domain-containing protein [Scytonematopsis contorta HA4267-MV1]